MCSPSLRLAFVIAVASAIYASAIMDVTGFPDAPPVKAGVAFMEFMAGTHLYAALVTALVEAQRTGRGRVVEIAMAEAAFPTLASNQDGLVQWC